ncbi:PDR/VanB family oxidoreductase [Phytopseudomonas dryadis]|uniref:Oxidoreductase n=1 Tax=Phytopseudomonas dryadis TaxID=2487520 RepID=A0ABY1Z3X3_9GAMM|nr:MULTISPECIES: PDR/VanB family oxidoreductase [Pseudomonas]TBV00768.1 oxidoreductase [Pseudomonas dryadis]TBV13319.1 oxidoreductase [Pseudomonas sp. FRB 230]
MSAALAVRVAAIRPLTPLVREFTFAAVQGELPGFSCGSHVQVHMPLGERVLRNAYSLLSDPADTGCYRIAVRLQADSRGGSRFMHEQLAPGDLLQLSPPSNLFPLHSLARHHVLVAGGIGITPFLSYVAELQARDASFELHYAFRGQLTDAYVDTLRECLGQRLHTYDATLGQRLDCAELLRRQPLGAHLYGCGPQGLLDALRAQAAALGWGARRVHWEAFAAPEPGLPFVVELLGSGRRIEVPGDFSLLEALEQAGVQVPNLCRGGVCGHCVTRYLGGAVEHRDHFLNAEQRCSELMPCVSRGAGESPLLLDL